MWSTRPGRSIVLGLVLAFSLAVLHGAAGAQPVHPGLGEWGDAPEGNLAYPNLGVVGSFPTLFAGAGAGYIWHGTNTAWFGNSWDDELDGNGGLNLFPPYEQDECYGPADGDAGLFNPAGYTFDAGMNYVLCDPVSPMIPMLGPACGSTLPFAASIFSLLVQNFSGNTAYINILFDWNQDGRWGGQSVCLNGNIADEHAVVNLPVPDGYVGPIGGLGMPQVFIGPNNGYVWARFSIMNPVPAVPIGWDGSGEWDIGETEDYLLLVGGSDSVEYGDAPEGVLAYVDGTVGQFPTCVTTGPATAIQHMGNAVCWFGAGVDTEIEGNANDCGFNDYDVDECGPAGGDAGLVIPDPFTLDANGTSDPCTAGEDQVLWTACATAVWGVDVDIDVTNNSPQDRFVNVLADWDGNGEWSGLMTCSNGVDVPEHVLENFRVPAGFSGPLSNLGPPDFVIGEPHEGSWVRFSITDQAVASDWSGEGTFGEGETEDYLIPIAPVTTATGPTPAAASVLGRIRSVPNPFNPRTELRFTLALAGELSVRIVDAAGRHVASLYGGPAAAGEITLLFEGVDESGKPLPSGVYFAEIRAGEELRTHKMLLLK